jgi:hypothetical protein
MEELETAMSIITPFSKAIVLPSAPSEKAGMVRDLTATVFDSGRQLSIWNL